MHKTRIQKGRKQRTAFALFLLMNGALLFVFCCDRASLPDHRSGPVGGEYILSAEQIVKLALGGIGARLDIHPHAEPVQVSPSLAEEIISYLNPVLAGVHVAEIGETKVFKIPEPLVVILVRVPVAYIGSKGEQDDVCGADKGPDFVVPFVAVCFEFIPLNGPKIPVAPAVI